MPSHPGLEDLYTGARSWSSPCATDGKQFSKTVVTTELSDP